MIREEEISALGTQLNQSMVDTEALRVRLAAATQEACDADERSRQVTKTNEERVRQVTSTYDERLAALERIVEGRDQTINDLRVQLTNASHIKKLLHDQVESVQQRLAKTLTTHATTNSAVLLGGKVSNKVSVDRLKKSRPWYWFLLPWEW